MRAASLAILVFVAPIVVQACRAEPPRSDDGTSEALEIEAVQSDLSAPLRDLEPHAMNVDAEKAEREIAQKGPFVGGEDGVVQREAAAAAPPKLLQNFEGLGQGFVGPTGTFTDTLAPPDTNGDVGPNHYFQIANSALVIFDKKGKPLYGPASVTTIFTGFGGACENSMVGDPVVLYDQLADRWIVTEIAEETATGKWIECFALSDSGDPTGKYHRYSYAFTNLNDYPKMGVWPDGYYYTVNLDGAAPEVCALDRVTALAGGTPKQQCFKFGAKFSGTVLPADLDGKTPPPKGAPNYLVGLANNQLGVFNLHLDWKTSSKSKLSAAQNVKVASFTSAGDVAQPRGDTLEALSDRLMYRLAYRNFGDHESLVLNHSVDVGGHAGVRWYELRSPQKPTVFQQGTYAPDAQSRWMGSVAMDKRGNIAAGFSIGSQTQLAGIGYAGRLATDPPGTFGQGEGTIVLGTGAESGISRWGDYSAMTIDPVDDCTFWYTTEYIKTDGGKVWHTRVAAFTMPGCN